MKGEKLTVHISMSSHLYLKVGFEFQLTHVRKDCKYITSQKDEKKAQVYCLISKLNK